MKEEFENLTNLNEHQQHLLSDLEKELEALKIKEKLDL